MEIIKSTKKIQKLIKKIKLENTIGFVPTMGALHEGHLSLIRKSLKETNITVVSIFLNPTQFGKNEDLSKYPKNLKKDIKLLNQLNVDIVYIPTYKSIYDKEHTTWVYNDKYTNILCGKYRPNHFRGVLTIVLKLFNIVTPDISYFGKKDYQQFFLIKNMVSNLNFNIKIKGLPIIREKSGLALSSRNSYLSEFEKTKASNIYFALKTAKLEFKKNKISDCSILINMIRNILKKNNIRIQYLEIRNSKDLSLMKNCNKESIIFFAGFIGKTRLIDNIELK